MVVVTLQLLFIDQATVLSNRLLLVLLAQCQLEFGPFACLACGRHLESVEEQALSARADRRLYRVESLAPHFRLLLQGERLNVGYVELAIGKAFRDLVLRRLRVFVCKEVDASGKVIGPRRLKALVDRALELFESLAALLQAVEIAFFCIERDVFLEAKVACRRQVRPFVHLVDVHKGRRLGKRELFPQFFTLVAVSQAVRGLRQAWIDSLLSHEARLFEAGRLISIYE